MARREENLAKNTVLFAIGNFGSKLLQIVLVPFYTRVLTDSEFGTVDVMQAIVSLLLPIASLAIYESVFRYAMEKEYDKTAVLSAGMLVSLAGAAVLCLLGGLASPFVSSVYAVYIWLVIGNTVTNALRTLLSQYTKAIGKTALFSVDNIVMTLLVLVLNILFIAVFRMGITGYMLGYTLANLFSFLFLAVLLGKRCTIRVKSIRKGLLREMLVFALPLIPNAICWWISSFMDRIMIVSMVGTAANGLYAAAHKIPSLLSVVVSIFFQAWQVSANEEFKKKDIAEFYSKIFEQISACIFVLSSVLIVLSRPITGVFLGDEFAEAWLYMPPLLLSMTFFSYAQFLGSIYSANKKTAMALVTNLVGVVVNVTLNALLIPLMGTIGAAVATAVSYLVLWLVRIADTGKIVRMRYRILPLVLSSVIVVAQTVLICVDLDILFTYSLCAVGTVVLIALYWKTLLSMVRFFLRFAKKILVRR